MINLDLLKENIDKDPNEPEGGWEDPVILYAVDSNNMIILLDIINRNKVNLGSIDFINEYFDYSEEESNYEFGIYKARITLNSYLSGAPDCQEWETDVTFHDDQRCVGFTWEDVEKDWL